MYVPKGHTSNGPQVAQGLHLETYKTSTHGIHTNMCINTKIPLGRTLIYLSPLNVNMFLFLSSKFFTFGDYQEIGNVLKGPQVREMEMNGGQQGRAQRGRQCMLYQEPHTHLCVKSESNHKTL